MRPPRSSLVRNDLVDVGDTYHTMDVTLTQVGYYNPNAPDAAKFKEYFIEGVDYFNQPAAPTTARLQRGQGRQLGRLRRRLRLRQLQGHRQLPVLSQLSDAQKTAVLATLGYKPLFDLHVHQLPGPQNGGGEHSHRDERHPLVGCRSRGHLLD